MVERVRGLPSVGLGLALALAALAPFATHAESPQRQAATARRALHAGDAAWAKSCRRAQRQLCLAFSRSPGPTCISRRKMNRVVVRRKARHAASAAAAYRRALQIYSDSAGLAGVVGEEVDALRGDLDRARLRLAALDHESLAALQPPELALVGDQRKAAQKAGLDYQRWLQKVQRAAARSFEGYRALVEEGGDPRTVALAARGGGDVHALLAFAILSTGVPRALRSSEERVAFCEPVREAASDPARRASLAYESCRSWAEAAGLSQASCEPLAALRVGELAERAPR